METTTPQPQKPLRRSKFKLITGIFMVVFAVTLGVPSALGLWTSFFGTHQPGTFVVANCDTGRGRGSGNATGATRCTGTFTPNNSALNPVVYSGDTGVDVYSNLAPDSSHPAYALLLPGDRQPTSGNQVILEDVGSSRLASSALWVVFSIICLAAGWMGIRFIRMSKYDG